MSVLVAIPAAVDIKVLEKIQNTPRPTIEVDPEFGDIFEEIKKTREAIKDIFFK